MAWCFDNLNLIDHNFCIYYRLHSSPVDIYGVLKLVSRSLLYGNNINSGAIIFTSIAIGFHFYLIWEVTFVDEWLYNGGLYELIVLQFLLGIACYMGCEWKLSFRLGMRP